MKSVKWTISRIDIKQCLGLRISRVLSVAMPCLLRI